MTRPTPQQGPSRISRLVPVTLKDSRKLLAWRNDPLTRQSSFSQEVIEAAEHQAWLNQALANPDCHLFIARNEQDEEVGPVRFEVLGEAAEIHLSIAPEFRGQGYGTQLVRFSTEFFLMQHPSVKKIISRIKDDNEASLRIFTGAGYRHYQPQGKVRHLVFDRPSQLPLKK